MKDEITRFSIPAAALMLICTLLLFMAGCSSETTYTPAPGSKGPAITSYSFGRMTINGRNYTCEVQIFPNGDVREWTLQDPHYIVPADIEEIVNSGIEMLIIGTGDVGNAGVPEETHRFLESKNIKVRELNTHEAVELFNSSPKDKLGAVFHLNC